MTRTMTSLVAAAAVCFGAQVCAGDMAMDSSKMTTEQKQMMKDCMAQQKAKDSSMSKGDMKKTCETQMTMQHDQSMSSSPPKSDTPPMNSNPK